MSRFTAVLLLTAVALFGTQAHAAEYVSEDTLRVRLQSATWPADIVRLATEYRARFPYGEFRQQADQLNRRAAEAVRVLERKDVQLYRAAFTTPLDTAALREDVRRAGLADGQAALRVAQAYRDGTGVGADSNRHLGWLQYAASLGSDYASYELALHYRREAQIPLASLYEARAVQLGYVLPTALDHVRK